mgnify:CR=1 FL=1
MLSSRLSEDTIQGSYLCVCVCVCVCEGYITYHYEKYLSLHGLLKKEHPLNIEGDM